VTPGLLRLPVRTLLGLSLPFVLSACITEGPSPPRVDVPEPGAAGHARGSAPARRAAPSAYPAGAAARSYPATAPAAASPGLPAGDAGDITVQSSSETPAVGSYPAVSASTYPQGGTEGYPAPAEAYPAAAQPVPAEGATSAPPAAAVIEEGHVPARSANNAVNALLASADGARRRGDLDAAVAAAERALRIQPGDPAVYCELALLRLAQGQRELAGQLARKGLAQQPEPELRQRLEEVLARATAASG
jgi:tetratricopeptide (TPR) repeat protein